MQQLVNYNGQLINLNGGVLANKFPIRDGLMLYVDSRIDACYPRTGTTVNDLSVSALSGTLANGVEHTPNKYFSTDGVDDYIEIPVSGDPTKTYTVNILARVTGKRLSSANQTYNRTTFFAFSNSNISDGKGWRTFALQTWDSVDEYMLTFRGNGDSSYYNPVSANLRFINGGLGDFHLLTIVHAPDITKLYINGSLHTQRPDYTLGNNGFDKVWIGTRWVGNYVEHSMQGDFAFFQMHERELSQSEIQSIYSNVKQDYGKIIDDGLVLNLDADNYSSYFGSGTTWHDVSPSGNDATLTNGPTFQSDPAAIVFDGVDDYGTFSGVLDNFSDGTEPFSIEMWVSAPDHPNNYWGYVLHNNAGTSIGFSFVTIAVNPSGYYVASVFGQWQQMITSVDKSNIAHIVLTYDGNLNQKVYVNNSFENSYDQSGSYTSDTITTLGGTRHDAGFRPLEGNIHEVRVYNKELTADEIEYNFNARRGRYGI